MKGHELVPLYLGWTTRLSAAINARYGAEHLCEGAAGGAGGGTNGKRGC